MQHAETYYPRKWRPSLGMIVAAMLVFVLALPLGGIWLFRFYDNHLLRETEFELIVQAAFIQAIVKQELEAQNYSSEKLPRFVTESGSRSTVSTFLQPTLDLTNSPQLPSRAEARATPKLADPEIREIGSKLNSLTQDAQRTTLAGFRILDANGIVISGREETGMSLAHVPEVRTALTGRYSSVIRERNSDNPRPPIYSISRGTDIRVFIAMPIEYRGRVAGVAYLSRTPSHFLRELYGQRWKLAGAVLFMLLITTILAVIFVRTIKGPIETLNTRIQKIGKGDRSASRPLPYHGTKEIAELAEGLFSMAAKLQDRSDYIRTFANHVSHELKSPLTSIQGAAELLGESGETMLPAKRKQFLDNIQSDTTRLTHLLVRLRDLAATEAPVSPETTTLQEVLPVTGAEYPSLKIIANNLPTAPLAISSENFRIVLGNLLENSIKHEATRIELEAVIEEGFLQLSVRDDGTGISEANIDKVLDMFFTTRRDHGGTGMGLNIVLSMLKMHGGSLQVLPSEHGAHFQLAVPIAK